MPDVIAPCIKYVFKRLVNRYRLILHAACSKHNNNTPQTIIKNENKTLIVHLRFEMLRNRKIRPPFNPHVIVVLVRRRMFHAFLS